MKHLPAIVCAALLLLGATSTWAQGLPDTTQLAKELRSLTTAIDKLTAQFDDDKQQRDEEVRFRKLDLAIAYLNFRSRRIESLEREISSQQSIRSRLDENLPIIAQRIRDYEIRMQEYPQGPPAELKEAHEDLLTQHQVIRERIARIDDNLVMKENLMYELQNQIRDVEDYVQKHLEM